MPQEGFSHGQKNARIHITGPGSHEYTGRWVKFAGHRTSLESKDWMKSILDVMGKLSQSRIVIKEFSMAGKEFKISSIIRFDKF